MREVVEGRATPSVLAALLAALVVKGERPAEIVGFARTMREHAVPLSSPPPNVFDTSGTGGDRSGTFNISSAAANRRGSVRGARREAREPVRVESLRQRRCL